MSLFNLRIRGRLYGGFGALVLFGLAMAGFAVWKLTEIRDDVSAMNAQSANAMRSMEISAELQALRRAMLRYTFDQDEASFAEAEKLLTQVGGVLEETIKASSEERRASLSRGRKDDQRSEEQARRSRQYRQGDARQPQGAACRR